jgi:hypothetical protein
MMAASRRATARALPIGRRSFLRAAALRGLGASVALPAFESLSAAAVAAAPGGSAIPTRMAFVYVPNGVNLQHWRPAGDGADYTLGRSLEPLAPFKGDFQIVGGGAPPNAPPGKDGGDKDKDKDGGKPPKVKV